MLLDWSYNTYIWHFRLQYHIEIIHWFLSVQVFDTNCKILCQWGLQACFHCAREKFLHFDYPYHSLVYLTKPHIYFTFNVYLTKLQRLFDKIPTFIWLDFNAYFTSIVYLTKFQPLFDEISTFISLPSFIWLNYNLYFIILNFNVSFTKFPLLL